MVGGRRHLVDILRLDRSGRRSPRLRRSLSRGAPVPRAGGRRRSALPVDRRSLGRGRGWRRRGTLTASAGREQCRRRGQPQEHRGREQGTQHAVPAGCDQRRTKRRARAAPTPLGAGQLPMGRERVTAPARPRGHAATLADNDVASSSVNPRPPRRSCGSRVRLRSASAAGGGPPAPSRPGRDADVGLSSCGWSSRGVPSRGRALDRETAGSPPPRSSVHQPQGLPRSPGLAPARGPARAPDMWSPLVPQAFLAVGPAAVRIRPGPA
jgi:hypothetical protein